MPHKHEYEFLNKQFFDPDSKYKLSVYFDAKQTDSATDAESFVLSCEERDIGCIIPRISEDRRLDPGELEHFRDAYLAMLSAGKQRGIQIAFNLEGAIEDAVISAERESFDDNKMRSKVLIRRDYICSEQEEVKLCLHSGALMSLVAVGDRGMPTDLREHITNGVLQWQAPRGNWTISEFLCIDEEELNYANVLSYDASMAYLETAFSLFSDIFEDYIPAVMPAIAYSNVCFASKNRRDWDPSFNEAFEKRYGFDPSPYYPCLFSAGMKNSEHFKALFFECRADMMANGMIRALNDFAENHGLYIVGTVSEPKLSACSFINGDAMLCGRYAPGALLDKAYMYGTNSLKIAAAASYNFGEDKVFCELFRDYYKISKRIMYNDVLNAYARGANLLSAHMPALAEKSRLSEEPFVKSETAPDWQSEFACFTSRTQALLRGGTHISDIGVLYPIYSIHSNVNLYQSEISGFEYPDTSDNLDYMTLINSVTMYSGHDLTVIHPNTLNDKSYIDNGKLYFNNGKKTECLSVIILPCTEMISIKSMRLLKEFYMSGGKLIATGRLPRQSFEFSPTESFDAEVCLISEEIFGKDAVNDNIMKSYCHNKNDNGGEAYFLYFSHTAADGTQMTSSRRLNEAICAFDIPYDMYLPGMPRLECTGSLNTPYFEFVRLGLTNSIPGGGMLNHIHKRHGNTDVYYFTNTTERDYSSHVMLRGALSPEEWDPHAVSVNPLEFDYVRWQGEIYTRIVLRLRHASSVFVISDTDINPPDISGNIVSLHSISELN